MAANKVIFGETVVIDLTMDTLTASKLTVGYTAHDRGGNAITGTNDFDSNTTDANASASEILSGQTAYVNKNKVTGEMPNRGAVAGTISTADGVYHVQNGYHDGSGTVEIDSTEQAKIIAGNIKAGVQILGVTGDYSGEAVSAQAKEHITPYTTSQTILPDQGYDYLSEVQIDGIAYTETPNSFGTTVTIGTVAPVSP